MISTNGDIFRNLHFTRSVWASTNVTKPAMEDIRGALCHFKSMIMSRMLPWLNTVKT